MLFHDSDNGKAARFAKSVAGEKFKNAFAGWMNQGIYKKQTKPAL